MSEFIEFGSKDAADRARERYSEYRCPIDDDRRLKTVAFVSDTPESLLQQIEAEATEDRSAAEQRSNTAPLTDRERDKIGDLDGFDRTTTTMSWASAKGVFTREGLGDQFRDAIGYLTDYDDPAEGAEQYVREYEAGGSGGGSRDVGEEDITARQRDRRAAAREQEEGCDHARDVCRNGDPQACEFLEEACGFDPEEVDEILGADDDPADADPDEITGKAAGALSRSWKGYRGAIAELGDALDHVEEAWENATDAADAINGVRSQHGQDAIHFDALEEANAELLDLVRHAAADCVECHADHSDHDHAVTSGDRETLGEFVGDGAASTPVGTSENTDSAIAEQSDRPTDAELAERAPSRPEPAGMDTDPEGPAAPPDPTPNRPPESIPDAPRSEMLRDTALAPSDFDPTIGRTRPEGQRAQKRHRERLDAVAAADATADGDTPDGSEQFASEQQGTLGTGVDAEQAAEEKQVTLGGGDATESNRALPSAWRLDTEQAGRALEYSAGPYTLELTRQVDGPFGVRLHHPDGSEVLADKLPDVNTGHDVIEEIADRVKPPEVSLHSADAAVFEAAAAAKKEVIDNSGGIYDYT